MISIHLLYPTIGEKNIRIKIYSNKNTLSLEKFHFEKLYIFLQDCECFSRNLHILSISLCTMDGNSGVFSWRPFSSNCANVDDYSKILICQQKKQKQNDHIVKCQWDLEERSKFAEYSQGVEEISRIGHAIKQFRRAFHCDFHSKL